MSFFIHKQAVAAIQFLYPELVNNIDYIVVMKIDKTQPITADGSVPLEDCFIAEWRTTSHPEPTIEYLKQVYSENNLDTKTLAKPAPTSAQPATTGTVTA
jgi:hypothetical protein